MKKQILMAALTLVSTGVFGHELRKLATATGKDLYVSTFCVDGHIVVVSYTDPEENGTSLQMIQPQHVVDGKIVPMKCDAESQETPGKK